MRHNCPFARREETIAKGGHDALSGPPLALPLMWGATSCHRCLSADACLGLVAHGLVEKPVRRDTLAAVHPVSRSSGPLAPARRRAARLAR